MLTDHVTCQRQLRRFIAIHASSPVASVFIYTLQNLAGNLGTFSYSFIRTVNSDMLLLSHTVFRLLYSRGLCDYRCTLYNGIKVLHHVIVTTVKTVMEFCLVNFLL